MIEDSKAQIASYFQEAEQKRQKKTGVYILRRLVVDLIAY